MAQASCLSHLYKLNAQQLIFRNPTEGGETRQRAGKPDRGRGNPTEGGETYLPISKILLATGSITGVTDKRLPFFTTNNSSSLNLALSVDSERG